MAAGSATPTPGCIGDTSVVVRLSLPGIDDGNVGLVELAAVAGYDCHSVMSGGGCDDKVWLRKCVAGFPALFH